MHADIFPSVLNKVHFVSIPWTYNPFTYIKNIHKLELVHIMFAQISFMCLIFIFWSTWSNKNHYQQPNLFLLKLATCIFLSFIFVLSLILSWEKKHPSGGKYLNEQFIGLYKKKYTVWYSVTRIRQNWTQNENWIYFWKFMTIIIRLGSFFFLTLYQLLCNL